MRYFTNKTIWITGASSGIGKEVVSQLDGLDNTLIISARNQSALEELKNNSASAQQIHILPFDLADPAGINELFTKYKELASNVDLIFHCGGISQRSVARETTYDVNKKLIQVNYLGTIQLTQLLLPTLLKRKGHIVVVSSVAGKFGVPMRSGYSGSKFALHGYFEALRAEENKHLDITMVCPGFIKTHISVNALSADGSPHGKMDNAQDKGMLPQQMVRIMLNGVAKKKKEMHIGGFRETTLAVWVSRIFPNLFRKIIARSQVT